MCTPDARREMQLQRLARFVRRTVQFINFPVVKVFSEKKWDLLPEKWLLEHKSIDLLDLASSSSSIQPETGDINVDDLSLSQFIAQTRSLSVLSEQKLDQKQLRSLNKARSRELTFKKSVELECFGQFLVENCREYNINRVVDVGCGLGHLLGWIGQKLPDVELVGVDCNSGFCDKGTRIYGNVSFNSIEIGLENSRDFIDLLEITNKRTALISLHGCGDLQDTLIKLFLNSNAQKVPLLLTIGCCYHKTKKPDNNEWILSDLLKTELNGVEVNGSALRMGAEMRFEDYVKMSMEERKRRLESLMMRAMVEVFYERMGIDAKKEHRSKRRKLGSTIPEVIDNLAQRYEASEFTKTHWSEHLDSIEKEFSPLKPKVQLLLDVQYSLQHVMESLILLDRLQFIHENSGNARLVPLFPTQISPRNMCLIANR